MQTRRRSARCHLQSGWIHHNIFLGDPSNNVLYAVGSFDASVMRDQATRRWMMIWSWSLTQLESLRQVAYRLEKRNHITQGTLYRFHGHEQQRTKNLHTPPFLWNLKKQNDRANASTSRRRKTRCGGGWWWCSVSVDGDVGSCYCK